VDGQPSLLERAQHDEQVLRLAEALEGLPQAQREAVLRHDWQDRTPADIGRYLGRSPAVAGLLQRGLKQLRTFLREANEP
jgi:DNA-directed RNA polymerase specialized sigma24 family protein